MHSTVRWVEIGFLWLLCRKVLLNEFKTLTGEDSQFSLKEIVFENIEESATWSSSLNRHVQAVCLE